jgi:hypothetical protein
MRPLVEQMAVAYATQIEELQAEIAGLRDELHGLQAALKLALNDELSNIRKDTRYEMLRALANEREGK